MAADFIEDVGALGRVCDQFCSLEPPVEPSCTKDFPSLPHLCFFEKEPSSRFRVSILLALYTASAYDAKSFIRTATAINNGRMSPSTNLLILSHSVATRPIRASTTPCNPTTADSSAERRGGQRFSVSAGMLSLVV
ncbi:uncharacterized protein G2W53_033530 [Senna tora]|uniref:Uncharacterized protein n=1 Tax=Senna tora TaxID=362788 RepID=A0A834WCX3_9FABA|nr:uncharacterized protein G2W53_033530 [Senna tora]